MMSTSIGNITAVPGTNTIVLTERADNMERIVEIIRILDRDSVQGAEHIMLEYGAAEDVSQKLSQLISAQASQGGIVGMQAIPDERTNSIVLSGTADQIARYRPLVEALDQPATQGGGSEVRYLYYADAEELAGLLNEQFGGTQVAESAETATDPTGGNVSVAFDVGTNSLVMRAPSQVLRDMVAIVDALDIPRAQVHIQAIIVEMSENRAAEFGLTWALGNEEGDSIAALTNFTATTGGLLQLATGGEDGSPDPGLIRDGVTAVVGNITDSGTSWAAVISALQGDAQTNVVQLPNVTVLDNTEAIIEVGQEVPFITGSYAGADAGQGPGGNINPFQTTERESVGTLLTITPRINEGTGVQMTIEQEVSSISESAIASDVITNQRRIVTSVYVDDGNVLVLGGLTDDKLLEGEQKVPGLGNIPGLRWLFGARSTELTNSVMMVFIRPTILRDSLAASRLTNERYQLLLDEQERRSEEPIQLMKHEERPTLPPLEALQSSPLGPTEVPAAEPAPVPTE
jgi:general secretion pathway protein D